MSLLLALLGTLRAALKARTDLVLENLALRQQLALLRRPSRGRGVGHIEMYDLAAVMEEDYEHVEHAERHRGHDEEVDRDKIGDVIFEEGPPGLRGRFRTARHEPTNRAL